MAASRELRCLRGAYEAFLTIWRWAAPDSVSVLFGKLLDAGYGAPTHAQTGGDAGDGAAPVQNSKGGIRSTVHHYVHRRISRSRPRRRGSYRRPRMAAIRHKRARPVCRIASIAGGAWRRRASPRPIPFQRPLYTGSAYPPVSAGDDGRRRCQNLIPSIAARLRLVAIS